MPCDYSKYPPNWHTEIRPRILERDGHCCKFCGVANGVVGFRDELGIFIVVAGGQTSYTYAGKKLVKIVLTIAHLNDPNPMSCEDENLAALCQKCHNAHDKPMRLANSKATREGKKKAITQQLDLF